MKSPTSPASTIATAAALSSPDAAFAQPALGIEELAESCQVSGATISGFSIKFIQECFPMHIEKRVCIAVPPMVVEQILSEVDRWHLWDPDTRQARLNGPFAVGARGRLTPCKGMGYYSIS
ncbi:hypothetical protein [Janthinobacterium sp. HLX7-2]|uniref:hypothetical protein n=1 Tax=Janthinobacterium sp. HLX7-2 TaxID=1259331 RepID=UPI003F2206B9